MLHRAAALAGMAFVLLGIGVFAWKAAVLRLPVAPSLGEGPWRVELAVSARGSGRGSVRAALPSSGPGQVIFDETASADRLLFAIRTTDAEQRTGVWSGRFTGVHEIVYGFRVELAEERRELPLGSLEPPPRDVAASYGRSTAEHPASAPEIRGLLEGLALPQDDPAARLRVIFRFVTDEIATSASASEDALLTLTTHEGSPEGKVRLLVTLLRAAHVPARPVAGLRMRGDATPERAVWAEAWLGGDWLPLAPQFGMLGARPPDTVLLRRGGLALVEATGVEAVSHRWLALREHLRPAELASLMVPGSPLLTRLSLYRLPLDTQAALRTLLLLPLGALVVTLFRNVIGVPTFGTFMPVLIALALRRTSLVTGLALVAAVILLGIAGRLALERLRLLLVPRLSVLLCLVVLAVTGLALVGRGGAARDFFTGVLLPMVILTMLIERFSITLAEEGTRSALVQAFWSTVVAVAVYPIFRSALAEHLMFSFPELVFCVIGVLIAIGGYTGYRVSDLIRFRSLGREEAW